MQCDSGKNLNGNRAVSPESAGYAPVVLFCYNRVENLIRTVAALRKNELAEETDLIIYSDGPKNPADAEKVAAVREYIHLIRGFRSVEIHESECNKGLANSVIAGVTHVVNRYGKVIVLEDDLLTHPGFLRFMNEALVFYEKEERVAGIHGWSPATEKQLPETFFIREVGCWGWGTWRRGWDLFEPDTDKLLKGFDAPEKIREFNVYDTYPYYQMLLDQRSGKVDSWAIRWYASVFLKNKLGLQTGRNLVSNIGGAQGTHCSNADFADPLTSVPPQLRMIPMENKEDILKSVYGERNLALQKKPQNVLYRILLAFLPYGIVRFLQKRKML